MLCSVEWSYFSDTTRALCSAEWSSLNELGLIFECCFLAVLTTSWHTADKYIKAVKGGRCPRALYVYLARIGGKPQSDVSPDWKQLAHLCDLQHIVKQSYRIDSASRTSLTWTDPERTTVTQAMA